MSNCKSGMRVNRPLYYRDTSTHRLLHPLASAVVRRLSWLRPGNLHPLVSLHPCAKAQERDQTRQGDEAHLPASSYPSKGVGSCPFLHFQPRRGSLSSLPALHTVGASLAFASWIVVSIVGKPWRLSERGKAGPSFLCAG